eukprot:CAMPEP_0206019006 /NCGR_PEP_ID=MMETSP1464-20131121/28287_1 /ASSEMBLY_ACC=CAM_ASM_001124 /TAXON_ID=119497 /ORGANISM="Exanthemachrysis gayraliae, Strain RCC1523" /LENGTH=143 /DNA_ID=CAMNT_0053392899 /DNA_START=68 /DNA_END=495 /DNA_ORIENTATION=-
MAPIDDGDVAIEQPVDPTNAIDQGMEQAAKGDSGAADDAEGGEGAAGDIPLECRDCGQSFAFTTGEQEFYAQKGFEGQPSRCKECRAAKKDRERGGPGGGSSGGGGGGGRGVCYAWQRGECNRGDSCRFEHGEDGGRGGGGRG